MTRAPVVLIVSEHEWASRSLDTILAPHGYAVIRAYNGKQAVERCRGSNPDAVFIDRRLPDSDGQSLVRSLLEQDLITRSTAVMIMTASAVTREQRLEALRAGAWEVLTLPLDAEELRLRVDRYVRAKQESDRARDEALLDPLTGFYSWDGIVRRIRELGAAAERFGRPLACIVFASPEEARELTDSFEVSELADLLRGATRRSDVLARIGPREFAVVAPDTTPEGARILATRIRQRAGDAPDGNGGRWHVRAGMCAIADLREAALDPMEIVVRATLASRDSAATAELN